MLLEIFSIGSMCRVQLDITFYSCVFPNPMLKNPTNQQAFNECMTFFEPKCASRSKYNMSPVGVEDRHCSGPAVQSPNVLVAHENGVGVDGVDFTDNMPRLRLLIIDLVLIM
jgi:hypothetical protein